MLLDIIRNTTSASVVASGPSLWTWGADTRGTLGQGTISQHRSSPVQIATQSIHDGYSWLTTVGAGSSVYAMRSDRTIWGWGDNTNGQLGFNSTLLPSSSVPVQINSGSTWVSMSADSSANTVIIIGMINTSGELWMQGADSAFGKAGQGTTNINYSSPVQVGSVPFLNFTNTYESFVHTGNTGSWTCPTGVSKVQVCCWGGGGRGGDNNTTTDGGGGGGGGAFAYDNINVSSSLVYKYYVGFGGSGSRDMTASGSTWFSSSAYQNASGSANCAVFAHHGGNGNAPVGGAGGIGGVSGSAERSTGTVKNSGGRGGTGRDSNTGTGGGGGGSGGYGGAGGVGGTGGASPGTGGTAGAFAGADIFLILTGMAGGRVGGAGGAALGNGVAATADSGSGGGGSGDSSAAGTFVRGGQGAGGRILLAYSASAGGTGVYWKRISVGATNVHAIRTDGTLWGWGYNLNGSVGDNSIANRSSPVQITGGPSSDAWEYVFDGGGNVMGITTAQSGSYLYSWGLNNYGQAMQSTVIINYSVPQQVGTGSWKHVALAPETSFAIRSDGTLWSCGRNASGVLGINDDVLTEVSSPVQIGTGSNWAYLASDGASSNMNAIQTNGTLWSWGPATNGANGDDSVISRSSPVQIGSLTTWFSSSVFNNGGAAIRSA